ncbi:hypothetical protein MOBT1_001735 [Malassezia obtusa]|uniref:Calcineurin-like phosphoesterase domain-containing protein n=1 Tax=Malassezia obtusa TaxID=76774 RepID=A0AAF0DZN7_9BASI|nr:hypothetical protein MOBT1_001735 [Malassezia obtusa]
MKRHVGNTTVITAIGNHDTSPTEMAAPASLPDGRANQFSWNWDYVSKLWHSEGWINSTTAKDVRTHYGGYSINPRKGLRVISFNTDFWYTGNAFAFINTTDPDVSGVLRFVTDELQAAEDANERAWIVGHVVPGWDGYSSMDNPTNLFYQIVTRYSHTIAAMFFGHTHEDEFAVYYHNTNGNSSSVSRKTEDAVAISFISPSITPLTNMNPGIRVLEVDSETYELHDYHQYYTPLQDVKDKKETKTGLVCVKADELSEELESSELEVRELSDELESSEEDERERDELELESELLESSDEDERREELELESELLESSDEVGEVLEDLERELLLLDSSDEVGELELDERERLELESELLESSDEDERERDELLESSDEDERREELELESELLESSDEVGELLEDLERELLLLDSSDEVGELELDERERLELESELLESSDEDERERDELLESSDEDERREELELESELLDCS